MQQVDAWGWELSLIGIAWAYGIKINELDNEFRLII